jgi:AraC-like DNA-binding protein
MFRTLKSNSPFSAPRDDTARASCRNEAKSDFLSLELALALGFSDQAHLTRLFRRFTGVTPGAYRAQMSKNVQDAR